MSIDLRDIDIQLNGNSIGLIDDKASVFNISTNVVPTSTSLVKNSLSLTVPVKPVGAILMKTGQTTSYRTGDDGDIEAGRETSFTVLAENNPFGNTNRFTDELGGSTYANNIVIDWSTYNGTNVLGYRRTTNGVDITWNGAIDGALALSIGSFTSGWRLVNLTEIMNLWNGESTLGFNYAPINITHTSGLWLSNTLKAASTLAWYSGVYGTTQYAAKISSVNYRYIPCRTFTVTGTILS